MAVFKVLYMSVRVCCSYIYSEKIGTKKTTHLWNQNLEGSDWLWPPRSVLLDVETPRVSNSLLNMSLGAFLYDLQ